MGQALSPVGGQLLGQIRYSPVFMKLIKLVKEAATNQLIIDVMT